MAQEDKPINWPAIEMDYRAGLKPLRQIAEEHGITEGYIRKRAKQEEWDRDLEARIREEADALIRHEAVRKEYAETYERDVVEANAALQATVRREQRKDISRARTVCQDLLEELAAFSGKPQTLEQFIIALGQNDDTAALVDQVKKAAGLHNRIGSMDKLAGALSRLIDLERQAFGIDDRKLGQGMAANVNIQF